MKKNHEKLDFIGQVSQFRSRIAKITYELNQIYKDLEVFENNSKTETVAETVKKEKTNIIDFPSLFLSGKHGYSHESVAMESNAKKTQIFIASPGLSLPAHIPDYRPLFQKDGLILLGWDKRITESGERFTAYWVTSTGTARFFASKPCEKENFPLAEPDHKSYAAEDGIEFYGQAAPVYIVHVAPELMMSNPRHGELRTTHINTLLKKGSDINFDYKYLLSREKKRKIKARKKDKLCSEAF